MLKRKVLGTFLISCFSLYTSLSFAQSYTLDECKQMARQNYPSISQYGLIEKSRDLTVSHEAKAWLPGVSVNGFGVGLTQLLDASPLGQMKDGVYGASLTVSQMIYDGGAVGAQRRVARARSEVEMRQTDVLMYDVNERVEQLFFGILMIDEQMKQVELLNDNLTISEKTVRSLMDNGMANQGDLEQVMVQQVQAQQRMVGLRSMRDTYCDMLGYFVGKQVESLSKPSDTAVGMDVARPELSLFSAQESLLAVQKKSLNSRLMPTVSAFGMAAYHNRILPILKETNLAVGLMVKWNIGALYTRKNDLASLSNQQKQIDVQRQTFLFNNHMQQRQTSGEIEALRRQMTLDDEALALRESILEKARKKVEMGTETVNELLRDVNAVSEAQQQKAIHEIELLQEINKLSTIIGK